MQLIIKYFLNFIYIFKYFDTFITYYFQNLQAQRLKALKKLPIALVVVCEGWGGEVRGWVNLKGV
jgi:hypothetical protein